MKNQNAWIEQAFAHAGGTLGSAALQALGVTAYRLRRLLAAGLVVRVKRGVYSWAGQASEWREVQAVVPKGVACLHSAALLHGLSTFVPSDYHLAIPHKHRAHLPAHPPILLYYWGAEAYGLGQVAYLVEGVEMAAYDREKTVCDFVRLRHKVGLEAMKEVLLTYLSLPGRNLHQLHAYGQRLRVERILGQLLEILV
jgi:predicted transcriptional regulator of viral defense system